MDEATEREYHLKASVKVVRKNVNDVGIKKVYQSDMVLLIPEQNSECMKFFSVWLPEVSSEYFELPAIVSFGGESSSARLAIVRGPTELSEKHYLFVMTKGVQEMILSNSDFEKRQAQITILSENAENTVDSARDSSGDFDLIHGQSSFEDYR